MVKVSRNEPCPCGSGKKYKHCCARTESLDDFRANVMERETEQLIQRVYHRFAAEWFDKVPKIFQEVLGPLLEKLPQIHRNINNLFQEALEGAEGEVLELLNEHILFDYLLPTGKTIYSQYFKKEQRKLRPMVAEAAAKWLDSFVSVHEIVSVTDGQGIFRDIFTGTEHLVDLKLAQTILENISEGDLMMSRRLCKGEMDEITGFLPIFGGLCDELRDKIQRLKDSTGDDTSWPQFLKKYGYAVIVTAYDLFLQAEQVLNLDEAAKSLEDELSWTHGKYYEVAQEIRARLLAADYTLENVYIAITLWHRFSSKQNPKITKMETMLAAVEYFMSQQLGKAVSQKDIATKYGVSAGTVSARFREFYEFVQQDVEAEQQ